MPPCPLVEQQGTWRACWWSWSLRSAAVPRGWWESSPSAADPGSSSPVHHRKPVGNNKKKKKTQTKPQGSVKGEWWASLGASLLFSRTKEPLKPSSAPAFSQAQARRWWGTHWTCHVTAAKGRHTRAKNSQFTSYRLRACVCACVCCANRALEDHGDPLPLLHHVEVLSQVGRHVPLTLVLRAALIHPVEVTLLVGYCGGRRRRHHPGTWVAVHHGQGLLSGDMETMENVFFFCNTAPPLFFLMGGAQRKCKQNNLSKLTKTHEHRGHITISCYVMSCDQLNHLRGVCIDFHHMFPGITTALSC